MKVVKKKKIIDNNMERFLMKEREIMILASNCSFIVKLYRTFKDNHFLYFLTNYIDGANFFDFLKLVGTCNR